MHLDVETTQRWIHGELGPEAAGEVKAHLSDCPECRQQLAEAEREDRWVRRRLETIDGAVPAVAPSELRGRVRSLRWARWAAGILLTTSLAGAAYALPGSPLPQWVGAVRAWLHPGRPPAPAPPPTALSPVTAGIAVPVEPRLIVRFLAPQPAGVIRVALVDSGPVAVRVRNGSASFVTTAGTLTVDNRGSTADYDIELPRLSPWVAIDQGDRRLLLKRDSVLQAVASPDSGGRITLRLAPPPE